MRSKALLRKYYHELGLRDLHLSFRFRRMMAEWKALRQKAEAVAGARREDAARPTQVVLLTAAAPHFSKSKGDEAMMAVVFAHLARTYPGCVVHAMTSGSDAERRARAFGCVPLRMDEKAGLAAVFAQMEAIRPDVCLAIGADVMDGSYSQIYSLRMAALTDLAARVGAKASIFGFSFSKHPYPGLSKAFAEVSPTVTLNLRDPVSFARFTRFTSAPARAVADLAFQLEADAGSTVYAEERGWIVREKTAGRKVLGLNIHPSMLSMGERGRLPAIVTLVADVTRRLIADKSISVLLVVHDFSGDVSCLRVLTPLWEQLKASEHVAFLRREASASELRVVVGELDGVVSARMHLAIAALGQGIPVLGINYKDKMEGLFQMFGFEKNHLLSAQRLLEPGSFESHVSGFVDQLDDYRARTQAHLPAVLEKSRANFAPR